MTRRIKGGPIVVPFSPDSPSGRLLPGFEMPSINQPSGPAMFSLLSEAPAIEAGTFNPCETGGTAFVSCYVFVLGNQIMAAVSHHVRVVWVYWIDINPLDGRVSCF
jgi:hypothetical protein